MYNRILIHRPRRIEQSYMYRFINHIISNIKFINSKQLLLPIRAKALYLKDNNVEDSWYSNECYKHLCDYLIKQNLFIDYISTDIKDGKQCANCDVRYEQPHWTTVLCVDCFEELLNEGIVPEFQKASGVEF